MLGACGFGLWHTDAINTWEDWDPRVHFRTHSVGWCEDDDDELRSAETVVVVAIGNFIRFGFVCCIFVKCTLLSGIEYTCIPPPPSFPGGHLLYSSCVNTVVWELVSFKREHAHCQYMRGKNSNFVLNTFSLKLLHKTQNTQVCFGVLRAGDCEAMCTDL